MIVIWNLNSANKSWPYDCRWIKKPSYYIFLHFILEITIILAMAQVDNLSREEQLLKFSDIIDKLNGLNSWFEDVI